MRRTVLCLALAAACGKAATEGRLQDGGQVRAAPAVELGLQWLARHQDLDQGRFDAKGFMKHDPEGDRCDGAGNPLHDVGLTGLATLAFLGAGFTDRGNAQENPFARNVRPALRYLMSTQEKDGCFGPRVTHAFMYNHVLATLAMCDAFAMTRDPRYRKPAEDGVAFILKAQNPGAGWRYDPRGKESDTSVTVWCVSALAAARRAGFDVPQQAFDDAVLWVDRMTDPSGRVGYNYPGGTSARYEGVHMAFPATSGEAMTAAGMLIRFLAGTAAKEPIRKGTALCLAKPPLWDGKSNDMYYWYFGTLAMGQVGGEERKAWNAKLEEAILPRQRTERARAGSWDPIDPWAPEGGRIYSTAILVLCLEAAGR